MNSKEQREYILIIGAMKSGTTTLFDLLAQHPEIAPARSKEPGFFAFEHLWQEGFSWYDQEYDFNDQVHRYRLDGSTDYSKFPFCTDVPRRLRETPNSRFKLLYIVRDPISRIESHAFHVQRDRKEVGQLLSPRPDHSLDRGVSPVSLAISRYASQIDQFSDWFDRGELLIVTFERLMRDQSGVMAEVWSFLGLDPVAPRATHSNRASGTIAPPSYWQALNAMPVLAKLAKALVPLEVRRSVKARLSREIPVPGRFRLTDKERQEIAALLQEDLERLRTRYAVDNREHWSI